MPDNEPKQTRATPRWVNLAHKPSVPDLVATLRDIPEPNRGEVMRNLSDEGWFRLVIWLMVSAKTPAELEDFHQGLWPKVSVLPEWYRSYWMKTYNGMWHYFLGGLS